MMVENRSFQLPQSLLRSAKGKLTRNLLQFLQRTHLGRTLISMTTRFAISQTASIDIRGIKVKYSTLEFSWLKARFEDIESLEPTTLTWIDEATPNSALWDIGANIGSYAIYAGLKKNMKVFAFEPSPFNIEFLSRNIWVNNLESLITVVPNPLSSDATQAKLLMKSIEWGNSGSTFGENYAEDGQPIDVEFEYQTIGFSMDQAMAWLGLAQPDYIKLDVDGIEGLILSGGAKVLSKVKSVLVEMPEFESGRQLVQSALTQAGLSREKSAQHNEIWSRT
jgi:FkbM family methyltransferase